MHSLILYSKSYKLYLVKDRLYSVISSIVSGEPVAVNRTSRYIGD